MIAPLPPQSGTPPVDPAGARPDPKGEGDAFADILAAAAAALPPAPHLPGPSPIEHGPAMVAVADLMAPEPVETPAPVAGLTDPAAELAKPDRPDQPLPAARIFNQDGFFGTSVDASAVPGVASDTIQSAPSTPLQARTAPMSGLHQADRPLEAEQLPSPVEMISAMQALQTRPEAAPVASALRTAPAAPRLLAVPAIRAQIVEAETELNPIQPLTRRFTLREPSPRAAVQVAMRALEQGVHVAARAEGLDAAERVRLHDEITALLARHGLSARSIRISAPARGARAEERLK